MDATIREIDAYSQADLLSAIAAYQAGEHSSIRACAYAFSVPFGTLRDRLSGRLSRLADPTLHRLLILDGHSSHITGNVIAFCIQRVEWNEMYIRAREKALTSTNIARSWKATGLEPLSPIAVINKLPAPRPAHTQPPRAPRQSSSLDLSLLHSSPPDGTELREANAVFNSQIREASSVPSPAKRYAERMTRALETTQSELVTIRKELAEEWKLLQARKTRKTGKRVKLKGQFVFSTAEVLKIVKEAEEVTAAKKGRKRLRMYIAILRAIALL